MSAGVTVPAEAPGGEKEDEPDDDETPDDHGFLDASPSGRESRLHSYGGDHDVHLGAPVATATDIILAGSHYNDITETSSA
jgi:hypothetical protein